MLKMIRDGEIAFHTSVRKSNGWAFAYMPDDPSKQTVHAGPTYATLEMAVAAYMKWAVDHGWEPDESSIDQARLIPIRKDNNTGTILIEEQPDGWHSTTTTEDSPTSTTVITSIAFKTASEATAMACFAASRNYWSLDEADYSADLEKVTNTVDETKA